MKLKKIASLALAGVMAISMLAGCSNKPATSEPTTEPTTLTADLVDALKENDTIKDLDGEDDHAKLTVTVGTGLQTALETAVKVPGLTMTQVETYMSNADSSLKVKVLPESKKTGAVYGNDSVAQSVFGVVNVGDKEHNAKYQINKLVEKIVNENICGSNSGNGKVADLEAKSATYTDGDGSQYEFVYEYTLEVAVSTIENPVSDDVTYVAAYKVTRTPTREAVKA